MLGRLVLNGKFLTLALVAALAFVIACGGAAEEPTDAPAPTTAPAAAPTQAGRARSDPGWRATPGRPSHSHQRGSRRRTAAGRPPDTHQRSSGHGCDPYGHAAAHAGSVHWHRFRDHPLGLRHRRYRQRDQPHLGRQSSGLRPVRADARKPAGEGCRERPDSAALGGIVERQ